MQNNVLRMALGIYEKEILFFGGTVNYSGRVLRKGMFSKIEEGVVTLKGLEYKVLMERYYDGSAIIYDSNKGLSKLACTDIDYRMLYKTFYSLSQNSAKHLSFYFFRRVKFFFLGLIQLCSIAGIFLSTFLMIKFRVSLVLMILYLLSVILFILVNKFYSYVRTEDVSLHTSFLLTHKTGDETDDFWTDGN